MAAAIPLDENGNPLSPASVAPAAGTATTGSPLPAIPLDENGQPVTTSDWTGTAERVGARVLTAPADFWAGATQGLGSYLESKGIGGPTPSLYDTNGQQLTGPGAPRQPLPSEALIQKLGVDAPANMPTSERYVESAAPWLINGVVGPNALARLSEAPNVASKITTGLWSAGGAAADWVASNAAQEWARQHGLGPVAEMLAGIAGGGARGVVQRGFSTVAPYTVGKGAEGGNVYDVNRAAGVTPPVGDVAGPGLAKVENLVGGVPVLGAPVTRARAAQKAVMGEPIAGTGSPPQPPSNLSNTIIGSMLAGGGLAQYLSHLGWLGNTAHAVGTAAAATGLEDPSFVRAVAGRAVTPETRPLLQQYINRGGLGATAQAPTPLTQTILDYMK